MTHETPNERRTRLIEQFMIVAYADANVQFTIHELLKYAQELADAVIAATPQGPTSELQQDIERRRADIKANRIAACDMNWGRPETVPSETEKRLIELVEKIILESQQHLKNHDGNIPSYRIASTIEWVRKRLSAIKENLGVK
jgi:hypothetical protein